MSYPQRYRRLCEQRAYRRRVQSCGMSALLEPYTVREVVIPAQRRPEQLGVMAGAGKRS